MSFEKVNWTNRSNQKLEVRYFPKERSGEAIALHENAVKDAVSEASRHDNYRTFPSDSFIVVGKDGKEIVAMLQDNAGKNPIIMEKNPLKRETPESEKASIAMVLRRVFRYFA